MSPLGSVQALPNARWMCPLSMHVLELYGICLDGDNLIRQGNQADLCTTQLYLNLINSPCRSFGSSQLLIRVASPESDYIQLMNHVGFPRNDSNQLLTQAKNIDSESTPDSAQRCMDARHWFGFICAQLSFSKFDRGPAE